MSASQYKEMLLRELARNRHNDLDDNFDRASQGEEPPRAPTLWHETTRKMRDLLGKSANAGNGDTLSTHVSRLMSFYLAPRSYFAKTHAQEIAQGEFLFGQLADEPSRQLLIKLMAFRILGYRKVKLPRNNPAYWHDIDRAIAVKTADEPMPIKFMDTSLAVYDLRDLGYAMKIHGSGPGIACTVIQKQYEYHHGDAHIKAEPQDIVIDAGGCWGDTSVYFAHEVGEAGKVVAFEFIPSNLAVLKRNIELNPHLAAQMNLVEKPIWADSGLKLFYVDWGPGSRVTADEHKYHSWEGVVETVTIDETVRDLNLERVDFIKMDIEGAELAALRGGEQTLRRYRPKLALSLYHNPEDFETIPRYIADLDLGYKFYLEHHTIYTNETVLYAACDRRN